MSQRKAKGIVRYEEKIEVSKIKGLVCAWRDCYASVKLNDDQEPVDGGRLLVVCKGLLFKPENLFRAEVDGGLCREHVKDLHGMLKPEFFLCREGNFSD